MNFSINNKRYLHILGWLLFGLAIYFPVFQDIDRLPLQLWDESRNANNAIEMAQNGHYMVRYYNGAPDMWELNPPLLTWLQSTSMKLFGYNEFAIRFPISLAVLSTIFLLIYFFNKEFDTYWPGVLTSLVLVTSPGYMGMHIGRTGDHDAVLILFLLAASLNYFRHLKYMQHTSRYLVYTTLFLILSVYTKSIAGLFTLPGLFFYTLYKNQLKKVLLDWRTYLSFAVFTIVIVSYYLLRENYNAGYLHNVWNDQLLPRFTNQSVNHEYTNTGTWDYFLNLYKWQFKFWIPVLILPFIFKNKLKEQGFWDITVFSYLIPLILLLILTTGTKNFWYNGPVFPFISMSCGIGLFFGGKMILNSLDMDKGRLKLFSCVLLILFFYTPYTYIFDSVYKVNEKNQILYNGLFIRHLEKEKRIFLNYSMFFQGYNAPIEFYAKALNSNGQHHIKVIGDQLLEIDINDTIMSCDTAANQKLLNSFFLRPIEKYKHCRLFVIDSLKEGKN